MRTVLRHGGAACRWFVDPAHALPHARSGAVAVVDGRVLDAASPPVWSALVRAWDPARLVWIAGSWDREARALVRQRGGRVLRSHLDARLLLDAIRSAAAAPGSAWIQRAARPETAAQPAGGAR